MTSSKCWHNLTLNEHLQCGGQRPIKTWSLTPWHTNSWRVTWSSAEKLYERLGQESGGKASPSLPATHLPCLQPRATSCPCLSLLHTPYSFRKRFLRFPRHQCHTSHWVLGIESRGVQGVMRKGSSQTDLVIVAWRTCQVLGEQRGENGSACGARVSMKGYGIFPRVAFVHQNITQRLFFLFKIQIFKSDISFSI